MLEGKQATQNKRKGRKSTVLWIFSKIFTLVHPQLHQIGQLVDTYEVSMTQKEKFNSQLHSGRVKAEIFSEELQAQHRVLKSLTVKIGKIKHRQK